MHNKWRGSHLTREHLNGMLQIQKKRWGRDTVVIEELQVLVNVHVIFQEVLQLHDSHFTHAVAFLGIFRQRMWVLRVAILPPTGYIFHYYTFYLQDIVYLQQTTQ